MIQQLQPYLIYIAQAFIITFTILLGHRDGKSHTANRKLSPETRKVWHRKGAAIFGMFVFVLAFFVNWWLILAGLIIRVALYDPAVNRGSDELPDNYIGDGLEWMEEISVDIFGTYGAYRKAIVFLILLIGLNVLYYFIK